MSKVLIVEDDPIMTRLYKRVFEVAKFEVHTATNGVEGLKLATKEIPDIILLDVMMSKMGGLEFLDEKKSNSKIIDIPVIVLTNLSSGDDSKEAIEKGALKFVVKSNQEPSQVVKIVQEILQK